MDCDGRCEGTKGLEAEKASAAVPSKGLAMALRGASRAPSVGLHARKEFDEKRGEA
jgi:hypothetical protein